MATITVTALEPFGDARIAFEAVDIQGSKVGLISEVVMKQT